MKRQPGDVVTEEMAREDAIKFAPYVKHYSPPEEQELFDAATVVGVKRVEVDALSLQYAVSALAQYRYEQMTGRLVMKRVKRTCGGCTACCTTLGVAHVTDPGQRCKYQADIGCSIYADRPVPCRQFRCEWLGAKDSPDTWRPDRSGVLVTSSGGAVHVHLLREDYDRHVVEHVERAGVPVVMHGVSGG